MKRLLLCLALLAPTAHAAVEKTEFDAAVQQVFDRYQLPGLAVGVVENGHVVFTKTLGELEAGKGQPVDADTLFKIASNSKAMTTGLLARLVDQGKLKWDDPVTKYLPQFRMYDPWVTQNMQVRDLLIHNSGLGAGAGDLMFWPEPNKFTRADILNGLQYLKPKYSFRSRYAYDNTMYVIAGEVAAAAGGKPYEQLVREEIFNQLGMNRCQVGEWNTVAVGNVAQPHTRTAQGNVPVRTDAEIAPDLTSMAAGGIRCSLNDMLTWAAMWLNPQSNWLSAEQRRAVWSSQTVMPVSRQMREWDNSHFSTYGYGWRLSDVDGVWKVAHTGTLMGMYSSLILLPDQRAGIVILTNGPGEDARVVLGEVLTKHFTAPNENATVAHYADALEKQNTAPAATASSHAPDTSNHADAKPVDLAGLLGIYKDPWFGEVNICEAGGRIEFKSEKSPLLVGKLVKAGTRTLLQWDAADDVDSIDTWMDFTPGHGSTPTRLTLSLGDADADFSFDVQDLDFTRVADCPKPVPLSSATDFSQTNLVDIATLSPNIVHDIRYYSSNNFVGTRVRGYEAPKCYLLKPAAQALAQVERDLRSQGYALRLFDCYRPQRAVDNFVEWSKDLTDTKTKSAHYPALDKRVLLGDYIAPVSGHSKGATVDLTLMKCNGGACTPLDMGTDFDLFDPIANTDNPRITAEQKANRQRLLQAMAKRGFVNYPMEWWHYTLKMNPAPNLLFDVPL
jgi:CubicO group peptidase (beta-lactamase class C family)/D-alanyl-D-alanine dipeptidase